MIISMDWIAEFTDIPQDLTPEEISTRFTLATCEVEELILTGELLGKVKVVEIVGIKDHPDSDHLHLVTINTGSEKKEIVCGAPNVKEGLKVPFAPLGTTFPGGFTLEPKKIRGILSEGMLCSGVELELNDDDSGLLELPAEATIGSTMGDHLNVKQDILLEIDNKSITHRPDLWGHYGMAREFAAVFGNPLKPSFSKEWADELKKKTNSKTSPVKIAVDSDSACLGYLGLSVDNIIVKPSPQWMQNRLNVCGLRPINNIVDISNYVMLETGMPNHLFDREKIGGGEIKIRRCKEEQSFVTLDEQERNLIGTDTVVCDATKPLVIAGIMGGLESGVTEETTQIFIEAANWEAGQVRRTSTRLGLRTDSLQRYEKSLDSALLEQTVLRILELVCESCPEASVVGKIEKDGVIVRPIYTIETSAAKISQVLGKEVSQDQVESILTALDFEVDVKGENLFVTVPTYRATKDVQFEADIIEEIGRVIGFDNITPVAPLNTVAPVRHSAAKQLQRKISDFLVFRGNALEVYTYPFEGEALFKKASWPVLNEELVLANALTPEHNTMRPSLIPSFLKTAALNVKGYPSFRFFENGRSFRFDEKVFSQDLYQTGIVFYDKQESVFTDLVNLTEKLFSHLSLPAKILTETKQANLIVPTEWSGCHPFEFYHIQVMGKIVGAIFSVHPTVLSSFKIKGNLSMMILDTTSFQDKVLSSKVGYKPLPKYPSSSFDCTVVASKETPVVDVLAAVKKLKIKEIESVKVADVYNLSESQKTVTVRTVFLDREKTLTGDFITDAEKKVVVTLEQAGFPLKAAE